MMCFMDIEFSSKSVGKLLTTGKFDTRISEFNIVFTQTLVIVWLLNSGLFNLLSVIYADEFIN